MKKQNWLYIALVGLGAFVGGLYYYMQLAPDAEVNDHMAKMREAKAKKAAEEKANKKAEAEAEEIQQNEG